MPRESNPISQLSSGRWQYRYRTPDGEQRAKNFRTKAEAQLFMEDTRVDLRRGQWIDGRSASTLFGEYADRWLEAHLDGWALGTQRRYRNSIDVHLKPAIGTIPLGALNKTKLQGVVNGLRRTLADSTAAIVASHLRQIMADAVEDRLIPFSPATKVRSGRAARSTEPLAAMPAQVTAIADAIARPSRALVIVGAGLGLRQGEAFGLSVDRIDFLRRQVKIDRQIKPDENHRPVLGPLKTANSYRTVPLPEWVANELAEHIRLFPNDDPDGLLFVGPRGTRLRATHWSAGDWLAAAVEAKCVDLTFHSLRHGYASALIRSGQSVKAVAKRLGNTPAMVMSTYAHLWDDDDDRTRDAIDELFGQGRAVAV